MVLELRLTLFTITFTWLNACYYIREYCEVYKLVNVIVPKMGYTDLKLKPLFAELYTTRLRFTSCVVDSSISSSFEFNKNVIAWSDTLFEINHSKSNISLIVIVDRPWVLLNILETHNWYACKASLWVCWSINQFFSLSPLTSLPKSTDESHVIWICKK